MEQPIVTARGVYRDLSMSPYEYKSPYGDLFKFKSKKKLEIYSRDIEKELKRVDALVTRHGLEDFMQQDAREMIYAAMYRAFYRKVEG